MRKHLLTAMLCISIAASAQVKWTIEAGYDLSAEMTTDKLYAQPLHGGHISTSMYWKFTPNVPLALKTGVKLQIVGYHGREHNIFNEPSKFLPPVTYNEYSTDYAAFIPMRLCYMHEFNDSWGITVFAGPQLSFHYADLACEEFKWYDEEHDKKTTYWKNNMDGKITVEDEKGIVIGQGEYKMEKHFAFNCSMGVGIGAHYKHLVFSATYDLGLFNRARFYMNNTDGHVMYSRNFEFSIGYMF